MVIVESYMLAVVMCFITMLCWGSWANTQKLATKDWKFQLFYWDYAIGVVIFSLIRGYNPMDFDHDCNVDLGDMSLFIK